MKKMAALTITGLVLGVVGIFVGYLFLTTLDKNPNFIFLIISIVSICVSAFCLFKATNPKEQSEIITIDQALEKSSEMIANNNNMLNTWNKTNETRDKLKLLKIEAAAHEEAKKQA